MNEREQKNIKFYLYELRNDFFDINIESNLIMGKCCNYKGLSYFVL